MSRFAKRLLLHTARTLTAPLLVPGLVTAWLMHGRIANTAVASRLAGRGAGASQTGAAQSAVVGGVGRALRLAVVGDTHAGLDGAADLHAAMERLQPDGGLHLGDYSDEGGLFELLRHLSNWDLLYQRNHAGLLHVLGNHDKRTLGRFWFERLLGRRTSILSLGVWRLIVLDNTEKAGVFSAEDVALLTELGRSPQPSILCFHKPPVCSKWPHHAAPERVAELFAAAQAAGVRLALCGHCHVYDETEIGGVRVVLSGGGSVPGMDLGFGTVGRHILVLSLPADGMGAPTTRKIDL